MPTPTAIEATFLYNMPSPNVGENRYLGTARFRVTAADSNPVAGTYFLNWGDGNSTGQSSSFTTGNISSADGFISLDHVFEDNSQFGTLKYYPYKAFVSFTPADYDTMNPGASPHAQSSFSDTFKIASSSEEPDTSGPSTLETGVWQIDGTGLFRYRPDTNTKTPIATLGKAYKGLAEDANGHLWGILGFTIDRFNTKTGAVLYSYDINPGLTPDFSALCANDTRNGSGALLDPHTLYAFGTQDGDPVQYGITLDGNNLNVNSVAYAKTETLILDAAFLGGVFYGTTSDNTLVDIVTGALIKSVANVDLNAVCRYDTYLLIINATGAVYRYDPGPNTLNLFQTITGSSSVQDAAWFAPSTSGGGTTPPEEIDCALTVAVSSPLGLTVGGFVSVRAQLSDPNEIADISDARYCRPCNTEPPILILMVDSQPIPCTRQTRLLSGTPRNGIYELEFNARSFRNGPHALSIMAMSVGCCEVVGTLGVTFSSNINRGVRYRDFLSEAATSAKVVPSIAFGVEKRALPDELFLRDWAQWGVRSGIDFDGTLLDADWPKHQLFSMVEGVSQTAEGERIERTQYETHVQLKEPWSRMVRIREKRTPQFYLSAFETGTAQVTKIREIEAGKHFVFGTGPSKALVYDGETLPLLVDLNTATDAALLADKVWFVDDSKLYFYDTDAGQISWQIIPGKESRTPKFVEVVDGRVFALFVGNADTRCYDMTFATPRLAWTLNAVVTRTFAQGAVLHVAAGAALYSSNSNGATPVLLDTFNSNVTTAFLPFVGLANGHIWKQSDADWDDVNTLDAPVGGLVVWQGGMANEINDNPPRGLAGGADTFLQGENSLGGWYDENELVAPVDASGSVSTVTAMGLYRTESTSTVDAVTVTTADERALIGTGGGGLFFVYQKSALSEAQNAVLLYQTTAHRITPFPQTPKSET